jgi:hypothetical protein
MLRWMYLRASQAGLESASDPLLNEFKNILTLFISCPIFCY